MGYIGREDCGWVQGEVAANMDSARGKVAEGGAIVIAARYREALGLQVGDAVLLRLEDGELRVYTFDQAVRRAQAIVRQYIPEGRLLSEELITERRREAERE